MESARRWRFMSSSVFYLFNQRLNTCWHSLTLNFCPSILRLLRNPPVLSLILFASAHTLYFDHLNIHAFQIPCSSPLASLLPHHHLHHSTYIATPWTAAYQAPPSMGFSRQKYWGGVPLPSPPISCRVSSLHETFP